MADREYSSNRAAGDPAPASILAGVGFILDGVRFACEGDPDLLDRSELALLASQATDLHDPAAEAAVSAFLQMAFGMQTYRQFRMHTKTHRTPDEVVLAVIDGINEELTGRVEEMTGRPTVPPLPSSGGGSERAERIAKLSSLPTGDVQVVPGGKAGKGKKQDMPSRVVKLGSSKAG